MNRSYSSHNLRSPSDLNDEGALANAAVPAARTERGWGQVRNCPKRPESVRVLVARDNTCSLIKICNVNGDDPDVFCPLLPPCSPEPWLRNLCDGL